MSSCVNSAPPNRSLYDTGVDLRTQVQEREDPDNTDLQQNLNISAQEIRQQYEASQLPTERVTGTLKITHRRGDLFSSPDGEPLAHCVSQDTVYGAGIAVAFKDRYGVEKVKEQGKVVGECAVTHERDGRTIFHLITKAKSSDLPTYENFKKSLICMRNWCLRHSVKTVSVPRLGCGLDQLEFQKVLEILTEVFAGVQITITIYTWS